jgi:hypothetical protein
MRLPLALCRVLLACSDTPAPHPLLMGAWSDLKQTGAAIVCAILRQWDGRTRCSTPIR